MLVQEEFLDRAPWTHEAVTLITIKNSGILPVGIFIQEYGDAETKKLGEKLVDRPMNTSTRVQIQKLNCNNAKMSQTHKTNKPTSWHDFVALANHEPRELGLKSEQCTGRHHHLNLLNCRFDSTFC
jgi:hypothetical protein